MNIDELVELADVAVRLDPPASMKIMCGPYYSPYYHFMYLLVRTLSPCVVVELGVEKGRGSVSAAMAKLDSRVIGIDVNKTPDIDSVVLAYPNFTFVHSPSVPVPACVPHDMDVLHIDTEHSYGQVRGEFEAYREYLRNGAVVLFDDLHANEDSVLKYFEELPYKKFQDDRLHSEVGYGVMLYEHEIDYSAG